MKRFLPLALCLAFLPLMPIQEAEAITFTFSDKTKKVAPFFEFRGDYDLPFNINLSGGVGFAPDLSSFVVPLTGNDALGSDLSSRIAQLISYDMLLDLDANLGYNFSLIGTDIGLNVILTPYAGYRHMFTFTGQLNDSNATTNTQSQGVNYGAKLKIGLPLGFSGYGYAGATTLFGGSFEKGGDSQPLNTNNMTLPDFGAGVAWNLPFFNLAHVYAGYRGFFLPNDLRLSANLTNGSSLINGVSAGFSVLFFGI